MSYVKVYIHAVWGTKNKTPFLTNEVVKALIQHVSENAKSKEICIEEINAVKDHLHCLILLNPQQSVAQIVQLVKGESSWWINKNRLIHGHFEWANEYYAVSVSVSEIKRVKEYIREQQKHHAKKSWEDEVDEFLRLSGYIV
jgi:REP element-mobilizing transposase RayT